MRQRDHGEPLAVSRCHAAAARWLRRAATACALLCMAHGLMPLALAQSQTGKASYYAQSFSGRMTASGERLHSDSLTCAHRTYPFGTWLKVTNLSNGKEVVVRVNDRGPFAKGRIIDLSRAAAKAIGMMAQGIAAVRVEKISMVDIPFKAEDPDVPQVDYEIAEVITGITPIWQQSLEVDKHKVRRSMSRTAKSAEKASRATSH